MYGFLDQKIRFISVLVSTPGSVFLSFCRDRFPPSVVYRDNQTEKTLSSEKKIERYKKNSIKRTNSFSRNLVWFSRHYYFGRLLPGTLPRPPNAEIFGKPITSKRHAL